MQLITLRVCTCVHILTSNAITALEVYEAARYGCWNYSYILSCMWLLNRQTGGLM